MNDALVLFVDRFWISPYAYTAHTALAEKGLPFEVRELSLGDGDQHQPQFRAKSITARVPALWHRDFGLAESSAIVEYVDEVLAGPRLLPTEPRERARARQIMSWLRSDLLALREDRPSTTLFYPCPVAPLSAKGSAAADKLLRVAGELVAPGRESLGTAWCIADADLGFMLQRLARNGDDVPAHLRDYAEAQWRRPSVRAFVEHARVPYVPYSY